MVDPRPPALECRNVTAGHVAKDGAERPVLRDVSFSVPEGARVVLLGRSGSGKTTLLRLLNRLDDPLSGAVLQGGRPVTGIDPVELRRTVAFVMQKPIVFEGTVRDNLRTVPRHVEPVDDARATALLADVGLDPDVLGRSARALSVGEQQRVCLARALTSNPKVLLLDEPTSALDPRTLALVADLVVGLARRHALSLVLATHQAELVERLEGTILLVDGGTVHLAERGEIATFFGHS